MPELPEVETVVNDLKSADLIGAVITGAQVFWPRTISKLAPAIFCRRIKQQAITNIRRRGKYIVIHLSGKHHLLIHLRMTGRLHLVAADQPRSKHEHVILKFHDQPQLRFHDTRKFGRFYLVQDTETILGHLGTEPLSPDFTTETLAKRILVRRRLLKPLLLDQAFIAGLGNIYVDEALWEAGIHPRRIASSLAETEIEILHAAIIKVLERGVRNLGTTLGSGKPNFYSVAHNKGRNRDQLMVFRRTGFPCPRCSSIVERIVVGQRSTHICSKCQKEKRGGTNENRMPAWKSKT